MGNRIACCKASDEQSFLDSPSKPLNKVKALRDNLEITKPVNILTQSLSAPSPSPSQSELDHYYAREDEFEWEQDAKTPPLYRERKDITFIKHDSFRSYDTQSDTSDPYVDACDTIPEAKAPEKVVIIRKRHSLVLPNLI